MFENTKGIFQSIRDSDLPDLQFNGSKKHPFNIILLPLVAASVVIIYLIFTGLAIVIDFFNLFVFENRIMNKNELK